jgi:hypothetical protein
MGYDLINSLENEFTLPEDIERRYGSERPDYVVRARVR